MPAPASVVVLVGAKTKADAGTAAMAATVAKRTRDRIGIGDIIVEYGGPGVKDEIDTE